MKRTSHLSDPRGIRLSASALLGFWLSCRVHDRHRRQVLTLGRLTASRSPQHHFGESSAASQFGRTEASVEIRQGATGVHGWRIVRHLPDERTIQAEMPNI